MLLGLWCRLAATSLIRPLAREIPGAMDVTLKSKKKKKKKAGGKVCLLSPSFNLQRDPWETAASAGKATEKQDRFFFLNN